MDSDLDVGRHCKQCNLRDFLPIACVHCKHDFCSSHIFDHACSSQPVATNSTTRENVTSSSCFLCSQLSISTCANCAKPVCPVHRFHSNDCVLPAVTSTSSPVVMGATKAGNPEARALLAKHFPAKAKPAGIATKGSENPHIQQIKFKHSAIPLVAKDASTPIRERIHFKVRFQSQERIFWCSKTMITGRAIDLIAKAFHITISDTTPVYLASPEGVILSNGEDMKSQVKDGGIVNLVFGSE